MTEPAEILRRELIALLSETEHSRRDYLTPRQLLEAHVEVLLEHYSIRRKTEQE